MSSKWLENHQLLVFSIVVPLISAITAWISSRYSTKRALKSERNKMKFTAAVKFAEFQHVRINSLVDSLSEFQSFGILPNHDPSNQREFYKLGTKIELIMNPEDPEFQALQRSMYGFLDAAKSNDELKYSQNSNYVELSQRILKREWALLKSELEKSVSK